MAIGIRMDATDWRQYAGAVALAPVVDLLDLRAPRLFNQFENGVVAEALIVAADVLNVLPDGTPWGDVLDGAAHGAATLLAQSFTTNKLNPLLIPAPPVVATTTPAAVTPNAGSAAVTTTPLSMLQAGVTSAGGSAASDTAQAAY